MEKTNKLRKINILLVILLLSMFIVIPIEKKNPNEIINTRPPGTTELNRAAFFRTIIMYENSFYVINFILD